MPVRLLEGIRDHRVLILGLRRIESERAALGVGKLDQRRLPRFGIKPLDGRKHLGDRRRTLGAARAAVR
jgi:hypothetical protein